MGEKKRMSETNGEGADVLWKGQHESPTAASAKTAGAAFSKSIVPPQTKPSLICAMNISYIPSSLTTTIGYEPRTRCLTGVDAER